MIQSPRSYFILLAEDNPGDVYLVKEALREHGLEFNLHVIDDGEIACNFIDAVAADPATPAPDLVLLDVNLPKRVGHDVLDRMRSSPRLQNVPVILLTSSESPRDKDRAESLGANAYFHKSTTLDEFMELGRVAKSLLAAPDA